MTQIQKILFSYQDEKYGDFMAKLVPTESRNSFIGVRSPSFKKIIPSVLALPESEIKEFLGTVPHQFHEENLLHISLINKTNDYDECLAELTHFLPYITNWAVSDGLNPQVFSKNKEKIIENIKLWIKDEKPYTQRVAMLLIMKYFLNEDFKTDYLELAAEIRSEDYYVNMMIAWLFAEALAKQWDSTLPFIKNHKLDSWSHNKAIQKAIESFKITAEQKDYLRTLKVKIPRKKSS